MIDPGKKVRLITMYPMQTGRNFTATLRAVDSIQLTTKHPFDLFLVRRVEHGHFRLAVISTS